MQINKKVHRIEQFYIHDLATGLTCSGEDRCTKWPTCSLPEGNLEDLCTKLANGM